MPAFDSVFDANHSSLDQTILVVDDTPENLSLLGEILHAHYRVRIAASGARALVLADSDCKPDLILLDVMMPDMDGHEVMTRLRENPNTRDIPVIFITALDDTEDETLGLSLGAADYITKPVRPAILLARVQGQIELKLARDRMLNQNAWLEAEVQRRMRDNEEMQDIIFRALASLAETRDNETGNHILRTQGYIALLCDELAQSEKFAEQLQPAKIATIVKAAPLHDIGKVGIPDNVLLKPGKLTEEEWVIMRTHPMQGADAIRRAIKHGSDREAFQFLNVAIEIAATHHEKWDGSGYPHGLKGEAIPLAGRLMALADVFDALISYRIYKPPMPAQESIELIVNNKGSHFDPDIVDAFIARKTEFLAVAERYKDYGTATANHATT